MDYTMHKHINNETDLEKYESYINNEEKNIKPRALQNIRIENKRDNQHSNNNIISQNTCNHFFAGYLKNHIGKLVKTESLVGNCIEIRIGILLEVGIDYIVLKLSTNCCSMVIPSSSIKYITIVHDNDTRKLLKGK